MLSGQILPEQMLPGSVVSWDGPRYLPLKVRSKRTGFSCNWHERSPFQLVAVQAVDWHDDSRPLFSLFFSLFFFSITTFSHKRRARIKKLILRKLTKGPKNLRVHPFPDPCGHFGATWRPIWIFKALIEAGGEVVQEVQRCRQ